MLPVCLLVIFGKESYKGIVIPLSNFPCLSVEKLYFLLTFLSLPFDSSLITNY